MKEMKLSKSLLFFGLPGAAIFLGFQFLLPAMLEAGAPMYWTVLINLWTPILLMVAYVLRQWRLSGNAFREFFWIGKLSKRDLLFVVLAFIIVQAGELALAGSREWLASLPGFAAPDYFPEIFSPNFDIVVPLETFMGIELQGNTFALWFWALWLIVNIGGEELLWRGYALPRMELHFGKWAWLVNGLLWNLVFHFFMRWSAIGLLPVSLLVPYLCQKKKSLWPGVIIHGLGNFALYVILIPSVFQ